MGQQRVLITGSAGFIGYHLAKTIAADWDCELILCDNFLRGVKDPAYRDLTSKQQVRHFDIDLCDRKALDQLPDEVDYIFHLAALNGTQNFYDNPAGVLFHSTIPTLNLIDKYVLNGTLGRRFVYAGTSESYATSVQQFGWPVPTDENVPLSIDSIDNPRWSYAISKVHGEVAVATVCASKKTPYTVIRYHNVYGPRMGDKHVVPDFLERMFRGRYELYGYQDTRSFIYVDDAVEATLLASTSDALVDKVVNIGSPEEITILDLGKYILKISGIDAEIKCFPSPKGSVKRRLPDISRLVSATGFQAKWSLEEGLRETIEYYRRELAVEQVS